MPNGPHRENRPSSDKAKKVIKKFEDQGIDGQHWVDIMAAVNAVAGEANAQNLSDSEKAEILFYLGGKIQNCSVI